MALSAPRRFCRSLPLGCPGFDLTPSRSWLQHLTVNPWTLASCLLLQPQARPQAPELHGGGRFRALSLWGHREVTARQSCYTGVRILGCVSNSGTSADRKSVV